MKFITRKFVNTLQNDICLTEQQTNILISKYCVNITKLTDKVLYSYSISFRRGDDQDGQGIITKNEFEYLKREYIRNPERTYCNREVSKHCYLNILFNELTFSDNVDDIDEFYSSNVDADIFDEDTLDSDNE